MSNTEIKFALNHRSCPQLSPLDLVDLAAELGLSAVELRNDVKENSITDLATATSVADRAAQKGIEVLTINALYPFNVWNDERREQAETLADLCQAAGAKALVCCPLVSADESISEAEQLQMAVDALKNLAPILKSRGLIGYVEALGFPISTLREKSLALRAIDAAGVGELFSLLHDTFHHAGARESEYQPERTGLVHISSVVDDSLDMDDILDAHRYFVQDGDTTFCLDQLRELYKGGYQGYIAFEPFADEIWNYQDPVTPITDSVKYILSNI